MDRPRDNTHPSLSILFDGTGDRKSRRPSDSERLLLLQDFFDFSPAGYLVLNRHGLILDANLTTASLLGVPPHQCIDQPLYHFIASKGRERLYLHLRRLFKHLPMPPIRLPVPHREGNELNVLLKTALVPQESGRAVCLGALMDVTELEHAERRLERMAEASADIIYQVDSTGNLLYCSPAVETQLGYSPEGIKGLPFEKLIAPSDRMKGIRIFEKLMSGKGIERLEVDLVDHRGRSVPFEITAKPMDLPPEERGLFGVARNISERKAYEASLVDAHRKSSEALALLDAIFESVPIGLGFWDKELRYVRLNNALAEINGLPAAAHLGRRVRDILPGLEKEIGFESRWQEVLKTGEATINKEMSGETPARPGQLRHWIDNWFPVKVDNEIIGIAATVTDITDRKKMEDALRAAHDQLETRVAERTQSLRRANKALHEEISKRRRIEAALKASAEKILEESDRRKGLAARLVEAIEQDRHEMGRYLHDQIGQTMTTLKMHLEMARRTVGEKDVAAAAAIEKTEGILSGMIQQVRTIASDLRPDVLETMGLVPAVRSLTEAVGKWAPFGIQLHFSDPFESPDPAVSLALFRILQEALNNIAKHARAKVVHVDLVRRNDTVQLTVEDDGTGFNVSAVERRPKSLGPMGLLIMRERAELAGGQLILDSGKNRGTLLTVQMPVDPRKTPVKQEESHAIKNS